MKAVMLRAPGAPVEVAEIPRPEPGPGEVLLRMEACGVCHSDVFISERPKLPRAPLVLGHEGVGRIARLGAGVSQWRAGDRVGMSFLYRACGGCEFCASGRETCCPQQVQTGYTADGALAEYAVADAGFIARIPDGLDPLQAAPLCCAGLTAYKALHTAGLKQGEWVAIFGAGGLGHLAIQQARRMGLRVAVVDVAPEKLEQARALGADMVINGAVHKPREVLGSVGGAAAALTLTGAPAAIEQAYQALKPNGILVLVGLSPEPFPLPVVKTVLQGLRIAGTLVGTRDDLREVLRLGAAGCLRAHTEACRLEDVPEVIERMKEGKQLGRAVVQFD